MGFDPVRALDEDKGEIPNAKYQKAVGPTEEQQESQGAQPQENGYG